MIDCKSPTEKDGAVMAQHHGWRLRLRSCVERKH